MTTRRNFLTQVGRAGGFGATYLIMQSLGLLPLPASEASTLHLAAESGKGKRVVILGAGIAGLVSAWELSKAGYSCTILEARGRAVRHSQLRGGPCGADRERALWARKGLVYRCGAAARG